jgi:hypothetical protein
VWRGYKVREHFKTIGVLTRERAANKIQRWLRSLPFYHRLKFLKYIKEDL